MDWLDEVRARMKRKNQVLFTKDSALLQDLRMLFDAQHHRAMVLWALEFAEETAGVLQARYPQETRPCEAVQLSRAWAAGKVKMHMAQRAILQAHAVAKEIEPPEDIALCHAVGQACGVVHTAGHAGVPYVRADGAGAQAWPCGVQGAHRGAWAAIHGANGLLAGALSGSAL